MESFYHCTRPTLLEMTWYYIMIFTPVFTCTSSCSMFLLELIQSWNINAKRVKRLWNCECKQTEYMFSECECVSSAHLILWTCMVLHSHYFCHGALLKSTQRTTAHETFWVCFTHKPTPMVLCCCVSDKIIYIWPLKCVNGRCTSNVFNHKLWFTIWFLRAR